MRSNAWRHLKVDPALKIDATIIAYIYTGRMKCLTFFLQNIYVQLYRGDVRDEADGNVRRGIRQDGQNVQVQG